MPKIVVTSDAHYGLKSAGFDRTEEIHKIMMGAVDTLEEDDVFIHCGDLGHVANPNSKVHALWMSLYDKINDKEYVDAYFLLGNHDISARDRNEYGSLAPLGEIISLTRCCPVVEPDVVFVKDLALVFLPYKNYKDDEIEEWFNGLEQADGGRIIVFSHLNVEGAKTDNDFILRPVRAAIPQFLIDDPRVKLIVNGHIHNHQWVNDKTLICGSLISTDFGDSKDKVYLTIDLDTLKAESHPTNCYSLVELDFDFTDTEDPSFDYDEEEVRDAIVKVNVRCLEDQLPQLMIDEFKDDLENYAKFVRPITPSVVRMKKETEKLIDSDMTNEEVIETFLDSRSPANKELILECALQAMEDSVG